MTFGIGVQVTRLTVRHARGPLSTRSISLSAPVYTDCSAQRRWQDPTELEIVLDRFRALRDIAPVSVCLMRLFPEWAVERKCQGRWLTPPPQA